MHFSIAIDRPSSEHKEYNCSPLATIAEEVNLATKQCIPNFPNLATDDYACTLKYINTDVCLCVCVRAYVCLIVITILSLCVVVCVSVYICFCVNVCCRVANILKERLYRIKDFQSNRVSPTFSSLSFTVIFRV